MAHAEEAAVAAALQDIERTGDIYAHDLQFTSVLLAKVLARARTRSSNHRPTFRRAHFDRARFPDGTSFDGAIFEADVSFNSATFGARTHLQGVEFRGASDFRGVVGGDLFSFRHATFEKDSTFNEAHFGSDVNFDDAAFAGDASFIDSRFGARCTFRGAAFIGRAIFTKSRWGNEISFFKASFQKGWVLDDATFGKDCRFERVRVCVGQARFDKSRFGNRASFHRAQFHAALSGEGAVFGGQAVFDWAMFAAPTTFVGASFGAASSFVGVTFGDRVSFAEAIFADGLRFGDARVPPGEAKSRLVKCVGPALFDKASFGSAPRMSLQAPLVSFVAAQFAAGGLVQVGDAAVALDLASIHGTITFRSDLVNVHRLRSSEPSSRARLVSAQGCDLQGIVLEGFDLRDCRFTGAHNLDQLRLVGSTCFRYPPGWRAMRSWPFVWRWSRRRTVVEEHHWRASRGDRGWIAESNGGSVDVSTIALLYRSLRKGREDNKDVPGGADFYYGEMEMRRHDPETPGAERFILMLYWLTCGYGTRAGRAIGWLGVLVVFATLLLASVGVAEPSPTTVVDVRGQPTQIQVLPAAQPMPLGKRLEASAFSAVEGVVFRASKLNLTTSGRVIDLSLRIVGPVLLALAVLSVSNRVRR